MIEPINVFCFPFAGGSKYSFYPFFRSKPVGLNIIPLDLPGRGGRIAEPLLEDIHEMVDDLYEQINGSLHMPYAFYGHSMGTILGYLTTKKIQKHNRPEPGHIFVSGRGAPSVTDKTPPRHNLPKDKFIQSLKDLGGSPKEVFEDENLINFFEKIIRADFKAIENYTYESSEKLDIPFDVFIGKDEDVTLEEAQAWGNHTNQPVAIEQFEGNHFFIFDFAPTIMERISEKTEGARARQVQHNR